MNATPLPQRAFLFECFSYDAETGVLRWNSRPIHHFKNSHGMNTFNSKHSGAEVKNQLNGRYLFVRLNEKSFLLHRVIWKMVTGEDPDSYIDHIDLNKKNNRFSNLRQATKKENSFNQAASPRNKTGFKGVSYDKKRNRFYACIRAEGKTRALGRFDSAEQAGAAYINAAKEIRGAFFRSEA